jgi:RNA polymerase primary sigma factor
MKVHYRSENLNQKDFLRQMEELVDFGRTKENILTKDEIKDYCEDMLLTNEQLELVYAYLTEHQIHVPDFSKMKQDAGEKDSDAGKSTHDDSKYLRIYRKELRELPDYTEDEIEILYERLQNGEDEAVSLLVEAHLPRVVTLAGRYKGRGVPLEDLIQEGNLELMMCVSMLCGNREVSDLKKAIDHAVKSRLIELVDEELTGSDNESSVLARVNLLLEATRTLAEEYGRLATIEELSEFTHMDIPEIEMYVELSRDKIELGQGGAG